MAWMRSGVRVPLPPLFSVERFQPQSPVAHAPAQETPQITRHAPPPPHPNRATGCSQGWSAAQAVEAGPLTPPAPAGAEEFVSQRGKYPARHFIWKPSFRAGLGTKLLGEEFVDL